MTRHTLAQLASGLWIVGVWLSPVAATPAMAATNGNYLSSMCEEKTAVDKIACLAYITGATDAIQSERAAGYDDQKGYLFPFCFHNGVIYQQITDVVVKYLRAHPETRNEAAPVLIARALEEAFPCGGHGAGG